MKYEIKKIQNNGSSEVYSFTVTDGSRMVTFLSDGVTLGAWKEPKPRPHSFLAFFLGFAAGALLLVASL